MVKNQLCFPVTKNFYFLISLLPKKKKKKTEDLTKFQSEKIKQTQSCGLHGHVTCAVYSM